MAFKLGDSGQRLYALSMGKLHHIQELVKVGSAEESRLFQQRDLIAVHSFHGMNCLADVYQGCRVRLPRRGTGFYILTFGSYFEVAYISAPGDDDGANAFMRENPDTGVLAVDNLGHVYVAFKEDSPCSAP